MQPSFGHRTLRFQDVQINASSCDPKIFHHDLDGAMPALVMNLTASRTNKRLELVGNHFNVNLLFGLGQYSINPVLWQF